MTIDDFETYDNSQPNSPLQLNQFSQDPILTSTALLDLQEDSSTLKDMMYAAAECEWREYCEENQLNPDDNDAKTQYMAIIHQKMIEHEGQQNSNNLVAPTPTEIPMEMVQHTRRRKRSDEGTRQPETKIPHLSDTTAATMTNNTPAGKGESMSRTAIPPEAMKNRYSPDCINASYDVLFQADPSQPNTKGLSEMTLAFLVMKILEGEGIRTESTTGKKMGSSILYSFESREQAHLMLDNPKLAQKKIIAYIPNWSTERKGVIKGVNIDIEENDILKDIRSSVNVKSVKRMDRFERNENGTTATIPTRTILLTFDGQITPTYVTLWGLHCEVLPYTSQVKRCGNCLRFGHTRKHCRSPQTCNHCGKKNHGQGIECPTANLAPKCINCKNAHQSTDSKCPELLKQRETHKFAATNGISYNQAKELMSDNAHQPIQIPAGPRYNKTYFPSLNPRKSSDQVSQNTCRHSPTGDEDTPMKGSYAQACWNQTKEHQISFTQRNTQKSPSNFQSPSHYPSSHKPPIPPRPLLNVTHTKQELLQRQHQNILLSPNGHGYGDITKPPPTPKDPPPPTIEGTTLQAILNLVKHFVNAIMSHLSKQLVDALGVGNVIHEISSKIDDLNNLNASINTHPTTSNSTNNGPHK